jgi:hypothetical protein
MTTLNDLKDYLDDEAYTVRVGELRALLAEGGKSEGEFEEWLNDHRESDVSSVFHEIIAKFKSAARAAIDKGEEQAGGDDLLNDYIELNMSNYNEDDVSRLNEWGIRAYTALSAGCDEGGKSEAVAEVGPRIGELMANPIRWTDTSAMDRLPIGTKLYAAPIATRALTGMQKEALKQVAGILKKGGWKYYETTVRALLAAADKEAQR